MIRPLLCSPSRFATLGVLALVLCVAGCGRKGPLDLPPSAVTPQPPGSATEQPAIGPDGRPLAPQNKKQLPIDWLLN